MTVIRRLLSRLPRSLALGLTPGLLLISAAGAHPAYANTVNSIINENGKCLSQENVGVVIDVCDTTSRQDWNIIPNTSGPFLIQNQLTGQCLVPNNAGPGAQVLAAMTTCDNHNLAELWVFEDPVTIGKFQFHEIENVGDAALGLNLVLHPSGCMATNDLPIFMNDARQCLADDWRLPGS